jgi:hypothetical protein
VDSQRAPGCLQTAGRGCFRPQRMRGDRVPFLRPSGPCYRWAAALFSAAPPCARARAGSRRRRHLVRARVKAGLREGKLLGTPTNKIVSKRLSLSSLIQVSAKAEAPLSLHHTGCVWRPVDPWVLSPGAAAILRSVTPVLHKAPIAAQHTVNMVV